MLFITLSSLLLVTLADSVTVYRPSSLNILRKPNEPNIPGLLTTCNDRPFGSSDLKIPICRTVWQYSRTKPPIETCKIGRLTAEAVEKLSEAFGGVLQPTPQKSSSRGQSVTHDGDMCCPTARQLTKAPLRMRNSFGIFRDIVSIPEHDLFQYHPAGKCLNSSEQTHCQGVCVQESFTVYLLAMRDDLPMGTSFEPFDVPSYCSCKNLGSSGQRATGSRGDIIQGTNEFPSIIKTETIKTTTVPESPKQPPSPEFRVTNQPTVPESSQQPPSPVFRAKNKTTRRPAINNETYSKSRLDKVKMLPSRMKYSKIIAASLLRPTRRPPVPRPVSVDHKLPTTAGTMPTPQKALSVTESLVNKIHNITLSEIDFNNVTISTRNSSLT